VKLAIGSFYSHKAKSSGFPEKEMAKKELVDSQKVRGYVYQCNHCLSVYDEAVGEPENNIAPGTLFEQLPEKYGCHLCEAPKQDFMKIEKTKLGLQPV
jgi:rubredoxin